MINAISASRRTIREQPARRHFVGRIESAQPVAEQAPRAEPGRSRRRSRGGQARVPAQEQRRVDVRSTLLIGEPGEAAEPPFLGTKIITKPASDAQIAVELGRDAYC